MSREEQPGNIVQRLTEKQKGFSNGYKSTQNYW